MPATSKNPLSRAARRRGGARGAIFAEAVIVVSSMTMMFLGLVFFRVLYVNGFITSRLARAGGIAYSMSGCDSIEPKAWIALDAKKYTILPPNPPENEQAPTEEAVGAQGGTNASTATQSIPGLSGGKGFLNPIATVSDKTTVSSTTKQGVLATTRTIFKKELEPRSYVTCGDVVRKGSFDEVFGYVKSTLGGKVRAK